MTSENNPLIETFTNYYNYLMGIKNVEIIEKPQINDWGWFVDLELNKNINIIAFPNTNTMKRNKYTQKIINIPETIKEYPSIRSMKSMKNLHDSSMIFEMDDDDKHKHKTNIMTYVCGMLALVMCCISLR